MTDVLTVDRLLETFLITDDAERSRRFYGDFLGLEPYGPPSERGSLFRLPGGQLLGLITREAAGVEHCTPGGRIPPVVDDRQASEAGREAHLAFAVPDDELASWRGRCRDFGIDVLSEVSWNRGGRSLYLRDTDGHLLELATPGLWDFY